MTPIIPNPYPNELVQDPIDDREVNDRLPEYLLLLGDYPDEPLPDDQSPDLYTPFTILYSIILNGPCFRCPAR